MQLAGPRVWGPPRDRAAALEVLRQAVARGVNHIDTSDYYGPHVVNELIREALHPYPDSLTIVTKVGARRAEDKSWPAALSRSELTGAVDDNLRHLGLETLDVVNLRVGSPRGVDKASIAEPFQVLVELQQQGLIRHLGLSNVTPEQVAECQAIAPVVCVQNLYNFANRQDEALIDSLAAQGIAYVPFCPLMGIAPEQAAKLSQISAGTGATPTQLVLAWMLRRSPNILLIPGTSSVGHLVENLDAGKLPLPASVWAQMDALFARP
jgi:aryl-alcohol dehydrogenase-like predicted oxidoreductase